MWAIILASIFGAALIAWAITMTALYATKCCPVSSPRTQSVAAPERELTVAMLRCHDPQEEQYKHLLGQQGVRHVSIVDKAVGSSPALMAQDPDTWGEQLAALESADIIIVDSNRSNFEDWKKRYPEKQVLAGVHNDEESGIWQRAAASKWLDGVIVKRPQDAKWFDKVLVCPYIMNEHRERIERLWTPAPKSLRVSSFVNECSRRFPVYVKH